VRVLQRAGVDFAILGPEEGCNGDVARRAGNEYLAQMLVQANVEVLNAYKPKKILSGCPHCFNMLKNEYPGFGAAYPVVHHSAYLLELLRKGRLTVNDTGFGTMTFHDSCYLTRWNGIVDAPRELLAAMNKGQAPVMPARNGYQGFCCGAGGARMFMEETIGERINNERTRELLSTGALVAAAACPFCVTMISDGVTDAKQEMQVLDIAEIVDRATE